MLEDPETDGSDILDDLRLREGATWFPLRVTQNTIKFDETPKPTKGVTTYTTKVTATRALAGQEIVVLETMDNRRAVVMLQEASGRLRLVGGRESFLTFRSGSEGSNPGARAGIDLNFSGELTRRALYYRGAFPVASAPGEGGDSGTVEIRNRKGELMARVAAGKTVIISSGFRVVLRVV
ncbi:hypothetical protein GCM10027346_20920 [Hymenobacter seoulensis]